MAAPGFETRELSGWGRYPVEPCHLYRPEKQSQVAAVLRSGEQEHYISRGLGRSYGDAALNEEGGVVSHLRLNRFLSFDPETGVLECEAGVSFADIIEVFLPRGFFLPVTPGTKHVTLGGAIAADVHGKNHHVDGTIARFVESFRLLTAKGDVLDCSPSENGDVFWATMGGMGLTGAVLSARLRLLAVESGKLLVDYRKSGDLDATLAAFADDAAYRYSVAWIDCLARGRRMGRSVLMLGDHAPASAVKGDGTLASRRRGWLRVPFDLPGWTLNRFSVGAFNAAYYAKHRDGRALVDFESYFYPLDAVQHWNRIYGKRGFVQYQMVFPPSEGERGLERLLERLTSSGRASFLAVLKRFGPGNPGPLSFPKEGYTLALDLPNAAGLEGLLAELDAIVLDHGGRVYLAKDATLTADRFRAMYPRADEFREIKRRLDPEGKLSSSLARRVGLAD